MMPWNLSDRFDPHGCQLADRHYNRQSVGSPQFVPPGRCLVLTTQAAVWVTSWPRYAQHAWAGAWVNTLFRREGGPLASHLIRAAVAATRWRWPDVPAPGLVTFVDAARVRSSNPGYCYLQAGFQPAGHTMGGLLVFQMLRDAMPDPEPANGAQLFLAVNEVAS